MNCRQGRAIVLPDSIRSWLATDDEFDVQLVAEHFRRSAGWDQPRIEQRPTPW